MGRPVKFYQKNQSLWEPWHFVTAPPPPPPSTPMAHHPAAAQTIVHPGTADTD